MYNRTKKIIVNRIKNRSAFLNKKKNSFIKDEDRKGITQEIIKEGKFGKLYRLQLVLSVIICTLGLLINSVPVIIGAMLIAPILLPIKTLAFSIATGNKHMYKSGLKFIFLSIIIGISISLLVSNLTPLTKLTPEIMARTSPTIIDLYIALASGIIAFLSLGFKKLWESIAGVAMATALIPPLCVTGIGLNLFNMQIAEGSFLLFITNIFAIILIGIIIFFAFGFFPKNTTGKKRSLSNVLITLIMIIILSIPLTNSMKSIGNDIYISKTIEQTTNDFIKNIHEKIEIENIKYQNIETDKIRINIIINVPNTVTITQENKDNLSKILAATAKKSVELDINIVSFLSVYIEKETEPSKEENIGNAINTYIKTHTGIIIIEKKGIQYNDTQLFYINLFSDIQQDKEKIQNEIEEITKNIVGKNTATIILWHENDEKKQLNTTENIMENGLNQKEIYTDAVRSFFKDNAIDAYIEHIDFTEIEGTGNKIDMDIRLASPLNKDILEKKLINLKETLETRFKKIWNIHMEIVFLYNIIIE